MLLPLCGLLLVSTATAAPLAERSLFHKRWSYGKFFDLEGHRGARGEISEATLPAFAEALKAGVT